MNVKYTRLKIVLQVITSNKLVILIKHFDIVIMLININYKYELQKVSNNIWLQMIPFYTSKTKCKWSEFLAHFDFLVLRVKWNAYVLNKTYSIFCSYNKTLNNCITIKR